MKTNTFRPYTRRADFGRELRGLGGPTVHLRSFKGTKLGPASAGRRLTVAERKAVENQLRRAGVLG
jgi:hypothetical protein